jgi:hypothetical protein
MVEQCAGKQGDLSAIQWFTTDGEPLMVQGKPYAGYAWIDNARIALRDMDGGTIRHEMLHILLGRVTILGVLCRAVRRGSGLRPTWKHTV